MKKTQETTQCEIYFETGHELLFEPMEDIFKFCYLHS
jgi:hypothetical protein